MLFFSGISTKNMTLSKFNKPYKFLTYIKVLRTYDN